MFAGSVWLGQEEHGSVRAGGEDVMSEFRKVKWLEQSDSAAFAKFYIKVPSQGGRHQTSLELEFPFAQLEKCFSQF